MVKWTITLLFSLFFLVQTCQTPCWARVRFGLSTPDQTTLCSANPLKYENASEEFEELEKEMERLMEELKRFERETEEKIRKDVLPALKKELEKLRQWLREHYPDQKESTPISI